MKRTAYRVAFEIPADILTTYDRIAAERGITRSSLIRQGLGVMAALHDGGKQGLFPGMVRDKTKLDTLLVPTL